MGTNLAAGLVSVINSQNHQWDIMPPSPVAHLDCAEKNIGPQDVKLKLSNFYGV
jgi:hypothetical protein